MSATPVYPDALVAQVAQLDADYVEALALGFLADVMRSLLLDGCLPRHVLPRYLGHWRRRGVSKRAADQALAMGVDMTVFYLRESGRAIPKELLS